VGPENIRKAGSYGVRALIDAYARADLEYFASLANAPLFLNGWTRREREAQALAYKLARITAPLPIAQPIQVVQNPADNSADSLNEAELEKDTTT
jgi:lysozyme family protein